MKRIYYDYVISMLREELKENQVVVRGGFHHNNRLAGKALLSLLKQGVCPIDRCFIVINLFLSKDFVVWRQNTHVAESFADINSCYRTKIHIHLSSQGQFRFFAKATGALFTRVTVVPTQPIERLILLRSERTVYIVSNSRMETKQVILPLSAPVSISMLLCFGNRHNHITVCDETIFISSMTLYQQAMFVLSIATNRSLGLPQTPVCAESILRLRVQRTLFMHHGIFKIA